MSCLMRPWGHLHLRQRGPEDAMPIVFVNSLGTDHRMWDGVVDRLPMFHCLSFDKRGHGLSATPTRLWTVEDLAEDVVALMDGFGLSKAVIAGCSVGGQVAQAMAIGHPSRVAGLVLSNTAARIGTAASWQDRIDIIRTQGMAAIADAILERWFAPGFRGATDCLPWRTMLLRTDPQGYIGTCRALEAADLRGDVWRISVPVVMLAGTADQSTPPALVRETAALIPKATVRVLEGSGHLPAIDAPQAVAAIIQSFVGDIA